MRKVSITFVCLLVFPWVLQAGDPVPVITDVSVETGRVDLVIDNIFAGANYVVDSSTSLAANAWSQIDLFPGVPGQTNWSGVTTNDVNFYRVAAQHAKIGQEAALITRHHFVSGTAVIVDSETIVINNFIYDGEGIDVRAVVSPSSTFSPYTTITDDLRKPGGYTNETLVLTIPPGTSLDYISDISIWCVPATVSFGDGQFLPP